MVKVKKTRMMIIGLFVLMGILFNITVYFDNSGAQDSDLALSDLRVSLVDKAYADPNPANNGKWVMDNIGFMHCALTGDKCIK